MASGDGSVEALTSKDGVSSILLLGSKFDHAVSDYCSSLVRVSRPEDLATIAVSFSHPPDDLLREYRDLLDGLPACVQLLSVGEQARAADENSPDRLASTVESDATFRAVPDQQRLTDLGVKITQSLEEIEEREGVDALSMCFRSLTPMLVHADGSTVLKFLQTLRGQLTMRDVVAHFHLNPAACEHREVELLKTAFDGVIDVTGDEVIVSTR